MRYFFVRANARLFVRVEDDVQLMEKLFDVDGRALMQTKGEKEIIVALLYAQVCEAASIRIVMCSDESCLRDMYDEAFAFDVRAIIIERRVRSQRQTLTLRRLAPAQSEQASLRMIRWNGKLLRKRKGGTDTAMCRARVRACDGKP